MFTAVLNKYQLIEFLTLFYGEHECAKMTDAKITDSEVFGDFIITLEPKEVMADFLDSSFKNGLLQKWSSKFQKV